MVLQSARLTLPVCEVSGCGTRRSSLRRKASRFAVARLFKQILSDPLVFGFRGITAGDKKARNRIQ
jgi:hypothetical protein